MLTINKRHLNKRLVILLCVVLGNLVNAQATNSPHFDRDFIMFEDLGDILSPAGNFIAGVVPNDDEGLVEIRLWDVGQYRSDTLPRLVEPVKSVLLHDRIPPAMITSFLMAFSPDEKYLAVRKDFDLTLISIPDFQILDVREVSVNELVFPGELSWSSDGRLLATRQVGNLFVWDVQQGEQYKHPLDGVFGSITAFEDGWLITSFTDWGHESYGFTSCTLLAESCTTYIIEDLLPGQENLGPIVVSPDGQKVVVFQELDDSIFNIWVLARQESGDFAVDEGPLSIDQRSEYGEVFFSANSRYMVSSYFRDYHLWDAQTWVLQRTINGIRRNLFAFLPDGDHFITLVAPEGNLILNLYQIDKREPIDSLDLGTISEWDFSFEDWVEIIANDQWVVVNLGHQSALVPLAYNDNVDGIKATTRQFQLSPSPI